MRIRRNAAKIVCPLSIPTQSLALAAEGDAEVAAMGGGGEMHVCELNQSPWDAMSFTPPARSAALRLYEEAEEVADETAAFVRGAMGRRLTEEEEEREEAPAVCDSRSLVPAELTLRRRVKIEAVTEGAEAEGEEERRERKVARKPIGRKKVKKRGASEEAEGGISRKTEEEEEEAAPLVACKKTDGKGWHCKREAQHPHSLCEYHLTQVRSYYSNGGGAATEAAHVYHQQASRSSPRGIDGEQNEDKKRSSAKKKTNKKGDGGGNGGAGRTRRKPPTSDYYYYYSGFGPWWGRRRNCGGGGGGGDQVTTVHDQAPEDLDLDDEDTDDVGLLGDDDGDDVSGKRRGRKPIKARSLKSLL